MKKKLFILIICLMTAFSLFAQDATTSNPEAINGTVVEYNLMGPFLGVHTLSIETSIWDHFSIMAGINYLNFGTGFIISASLNSTKGGLIDLSNLVSNLYGVEGILGFFVHFSPGFLSGFFLGGVLGGGFLDVGNGVMEPNGIWPVFTATGNIGYRFRIHSVVLTPHLSTGAAMYMVPGESASYYLGFQPIVGVGVNIGYIF